MYVVMVSMELQEQPVIYVNYLIQKSCSFRACSHLTTFLTLNKRFYSLSMGVRLALLSFSTAIRLAFYKR